MFDASLTFHDLTLGYIAIPPCIISAARCGRAR